MDETLGKKIDALHKLREEIRAKDKQVKELKAEKAAIESEIMISMDDVDIKKASGGKATASISENVVPAVEDWDSFYAYIHRTKKYHLLERRPASAAYREELDIRKNKAIPGVNSFTKRTLNLSKI